MPVPRRSPSSSWSLLVAIAATFVGTARVEAASCPIPGFSDAAFSQSTFSASGTIDSWNSAAGPYSSATACTDPTSCNDTNSCNADIGTNASSIATAPATSGSCTTNANVALPIPTAPAIPAANQLGAVGSQTITGPGVFSATSISESGNGAVNFKTASPHGAVVLYVSGNISFSGNGALNNDSLLPSNVLIMCTGAAGSGQTVTLNGNGNAYFTLYCPQANIILDGGGSSGQIWGAIVGNSITGAGSHAITIHYDQQVANMTSNAITCNNEQSRANPIIATYTSGLCGTGATCSAITQGSFVTPTSAATSITTNAASGTGSVAAYAFPYITGHMRANESDGMYLSSATSFSSGHALFDAASSIPRSGLCTSSTFSGTCRGLFTNADATYSPGSGIGSTTPSTGTTTFHPTQVLWNSTSGNATNLDIGHAIVPAATFSPALSNAQYATLLATIAGGATPQLGGVDRSTVAVIGPSAYANVSTRPQMIYFGGLDGMLHAVCGQPSGGNFTHSDSTVTANSCGLGVELWAFAPRVQLPLMKSNKQRVDGSVRVLDVFGDFTNHPATGRRTWHTILNFQTGFARDSSVSQTAATYAIDVTDPSRPVLLWEYISPGPGLMIAAGHTLVNGALNDLVVAETNDGTGTRGVVATALDQETGATVWTSAFNYSYPTAHPSWRNGTTTPFPNPSYGIPGGAVAVDLSGNGFTTDFVMADLYGDVWRLSAATGASQTGTSTPLFSFSADQHPIGMVPAIYAKSQGGAQYAVIASGGYDDPIGNTSWNGAMPQYVIGVSLAPPSGTSFPLTETSNTTNVPINATLANGDKAFSQATIVGTTLLLTTDSSDVSSSAYGTSVATGHVTSIDLTASSTTSITPIGGLSIYGGSSLASSGTTLYSSSGSVQKQLSATGTTGGATVNIAALAKLVRVLWLHTQ